MLDCTPDFIMVSVPVGGLNRMVVPTGAPAMPAAIPPNPVAPSVVPGCAVPADPKRPVVVPGAAKAEVVVVMAPKPPPKPVVAGLLKAEAPKPDGAVDLQRRENLQLMLNTVVLHSWPERWALSCVKPRYWAKRVQKVKFIQP